MESQLQNETVKCVDGQFDLITEPVKSPAPGKVLIQVAYSTCNPSDRGYFMTKTNGAIMGFDGSGTIIQVGEGVEPELVGKKVSFIQGAWAKYKEDDVKKLLILDDSLDLSKAANAWVNPFTALGELDIAKKSGAKGVVITAGASQLSKQFLRLAELNDLKVISIVRKEEHVKQLKDEFSTAIVLNQSEESFFKELEQAISDVKPNTFIDSVGGELPGKIFEKMPPGSQFIALGNLTMQPVPINTGNVLYQGKTLSGFLLFSWFYKLPEEEQKKYKEMVANDLRDGGKIFGTHVAKTIDLHNWKQALEESAALSTEGKFLIKCS